MLSASICDGFKRETADLYHIFADFVHRLGILGCTDKPILSDEGSGLDAYASRIGVRYFFAFGTFWKDSVPGY
jgi:hypothetical protein